MNCTETAKNSPNYILIYSVVIVLFMEYMDVTIVNTAIPAIAKDWLIDPLYLKFAIASYYLSLAIFIPISGWCADRFGTRKVFLASVALFGISSLFCALSSNLFMLSISRFIQGIGGAFMNPVARIIILRSIDSKDMVKIQGSIFAPPMIGYVIGPVVGGLIATYLSWHWIFLINLPIVCGVLWMGKKYIQDYTSPLVTKFDWVGFLLVGVSLISITFFIEMFNHYDIMAEYLVYSSGVLGIITLSLLIITSRKKSAAVLNFGLLKIQAFRTGFYLNIGLYILDASILFILPLMFQELLHLSPAQSGVLTLPLVIGFFAARIITPKLINYLGLIKTIIIFSGIICACYIMFTIVKLDQSSLVFLEIIQFILGAALIITISAVAILNYRDIPKPLISSSTALDMTFRQFSSGIGIGITALALNSFSNLWGSPIFASDGLVFRGVFGVFSGIALLILLRISYYMKKVIKQPL